MKKEIKKKLRRVAYSVYKSYAIRKEKYKATKMWKRGVKECKREYEKLNGPRFYMWFDRKTCTFIPLIHYRRQKNDALSMEYLQKSRLVHSKRTMMVEDMKRECFYYTPSKHGAKGCEDDNRVRIKKYNEWITYYMTVISEPMRKLRNFRL